MARTEFARKTKQKALERSGYKCEASGPDFGFEPGQRCNCSLSLGVQFDHILPDQLGGDTSLENCMALCVQCHKFKTRSDIQRIRKSDRQRDRHTGVIRPAGKIQSAGFPATVKQSKTSRHAWAPKLNNPLYEAKETT